MDKHLENEDIQKIPSEEQPTKKEREEGESGDKSKDNGSKEEGLVFITGGWKPYEPTNRPIVTLPWSWKTGVSRVPLPYERMTH